MINLRMFCQIRPIKNNNFVGKGLIKLFFLSKKPIIVLFFVNSNHLDIFGQKDYFSPLTYFLLFSLNGATKFDFSPSLSRKMKKRQGRKKDFFSRIMLIWSRSDKRK